ncbi:MAG: ATP-binding protein [Clostridia bacterium]|nr:ATP-binding protein [Clostridia bacterium]
MSEYIYVESRLTRYLDNVLADAASIHSPVAVISGLSGSGKTSATLAWLEHNKLPNVYINARSRPLLHTEVEYTPVDSLCQTDAEMILTVTGDEFARMTTPQTKIIDSVFWPREIDAMDNAVVVIDHYDWAGDKCPQLFDFLRNCTVTDPRQPGPNFIRKVSPKMIVLIFDSSNTDDFTEEEKTAFGI